MPKTYTFDIRILLQYEAGSNAAGWVAQCLEFDIAAQGKTIAEAKASFERTFIGQVCLDLFHNRQPLEGINQAPQELWDLFIEAEQLAMPKVPFRRSVPKFVLDPFVIEAVASDCRVM